MAYFEINKINLAIKLFEEAISFQENAEPLLGLASCLRIKDIKLALELAKKALAKDPNYVNYEKNNYGEKNYKLQQKYFYKINSFKKM